MARANDGLSNYVKDTCRSRADRNTLIKAQLSALNVATETGTSDKTEATRFSQCAHDQRRKLKAEDCDSIRCAQLISRGRRRIRTPHCLAHAHPTMCCIHLVILIMCSSCWHGIRQCFHKDKALVVLLRYIFVCAIGMSRLHCTSVVFCPQNK